MGDNRKFDVSAIFSPVLIIVGGEDLMTIDDLSLSTHGYQLLPLATSQLMSNYREFDFVCLLACGQIISHKLIPSGSVLGLIIPDRKC